MKNSISFFNNIIKYTNCKKLIVSGSCFEYNKLTGTCYEKSICKPTDHFTRAKLELKEWLEKKCKKFKIKLAWFRIFYAYGPNQRKKSLIP